MNWRLSTAVALAGAGRISTVDARRQSRTAAEILRRFDNRPGVILADEVGMGKTYVALAVAVSAIEATKGNQPVVVMLPASVQDKWPREWEVFAEKCLDESIEITATASSIRNGADFLRLLDDSDSMRRHLIFLTHGALTSSLSDPYIKLAILRRALLRPSLSVQRRAFPRWAGRVLNWHEFHDRTFVEALLSASPRGWASTYRWSMGRTLDDDPVPAALLDALKSADLSALINALRNLPLRESTQVDRRLARVRKEINEVLPSVWRRCLAALDVELPLLILDEAHHLKNPGTRLASLFANPKAEEDAKLLQGPLGAVFDRMLFLTATPFQLGHYELVQILRRFTAVRWSTDQERMKYEQTIDSLEIALDDGQRAALRLDRVWGRLPSDAITGLDREAWWAAPLAELPEQLRPAAIQFNEARARLRVAERLLKPWVIRHARPDKATRRIVLPGRAILTNDANERSGLRVEGESVLPFLLAARLQAMMAAGAHAANRRTRAYFSDGLASSFEAYRETRLRSQLGDVIDDSAAAHEQILLPEAGWYVRHIDRALSLSDSSYGGAHPKIAATAERAVQLWEDREKVLIFCFYIATGRALRSHIARRLRERLIELAAERLALQEHPPEDVAAELQRFANRFFDPDAPVTRVARETLTDILRQNLGAAPHLNRVVDITLRFVRTPSFLVRYVDVGAADRAQAFHQALTAYDASGRTLHDKVGSFGRFVADRVESERLELLNALEEIETGSELLPPDAERGRTLPNVRLANGEVAREARRRLMLAFNTPFFPEILIASAVMSEGVDLHLDCRYVVHHDLDWNPSVLEQRTGRVDRLGSKSELSGRPIHVYEPFLEATQDEKQFLVVKDRERWFNVVMGEKLELDEWTTDRLAERVELPAEAAAELALRLEVVRR